MADLEAITGVRPNYFESLTAAAYRYFADVAVDVAVVEVGLLGYPPGKVLYVRGCVR